MEHTKQATEIVGTCTRTATLVHVKTGLSVMVTADCFISLGRGVLEYIYQPCRLLEVPAGNFHSRQSALRSQI